MPYTGVSTPWGLILSLLLPQIPDLLSSPLLLDDPWFPLSLCLHFPLYVFLFCPKHCTLYIAQSNGPRENLDTRSLIWPSSDLFCWAEHIYSLLVSLKKGAIWLGSGPGPSYTSDAV